jgi:BMFP domain-containing protein YqiC
MKSNPWFEQLQQNVSKLVAKSPVADVEKNVRAVMGSAFNKMDLVTREDFDTQSDLLRRTTERVSALESQIRALETRIAELESKP